MTTLSHYLTNLSSFINCATLPPVLITSKTNRAETARNTRKAQKLFLIFLAFLTFGLASANAQFVRQISGKVVDTNGAAVANAAVELKNEKTSEILNQTTDANGNFLFSRLSGDDFELKITAKDFAEIRQKVRPNDFGELQITLQPAEVKASVTVEDVVDNPDDEIRVIQSNVATRIDATILETPATINTVMEKVLEDRAVRQADKALVFVPGVSYSGSNTGGSTEEFVLRGFSTNRRIFIDGYRNSFRFNQTDLANVERVDILKGAAGVLYGTAFPGGIVTYGLKKPRPDHFLTVSQAAGGYDFYRTEADAGGSLVKGDWLQYRFVFAGQIANQATTGTNNREYQDDRLIVAPSVRLVLPTNTTIDYAFDYYYLNYPFTTGIIYTRANGFLYDGKPFITEDSYFKHFNRRHKLELRQPFADDKWSLTVGGVFHPSEWKQFRDAVFGPPTILNGGNLNRSIQRNDDESLIATVRGEVAGRVKVADWLELKPIFGGEFVRDEFDFSLIGNRSITLSNSINPLNPVFTQPRPPLPLVAGTTAGRINESAIYAQNLTKLFDKVSILTGLRYLKYDRKVKAFQGTLLAPQRAAQEPSDDSIDYTISGIYNAASFFSPFVAYSTSTEVQFNLLDSGSSAPSRKSRQIEFGVKSSLNNNNLLLSFSGYRIDQDNVADAIPGTNPVISQLVGSVRSQGFEFEATGRVTNRLNIYGGYSYTDAFVSRSIASVANTIFGLPPQQQPPPISLEGKPLASVPKHQFSVYGDYRIFTNDKSSLNFNAGLVGVFDRTGDNVARFTLPDYGRVDVGTSYRFRRFKATLAVENLLDKRYVAGSSDASFVYQGARRTLTVKVSYTF